MTERELESQGSRDRHGRSNPRSLSGQEIRDATRRDGPSLQGGEWKSKRRSGRPKEGRETRQKWLVGLVLGVLLPIVGGVFLWAMAGYLRCESDAFRKALADHLSQKSGFKVHVGPIEVQGLNLSAPNISLSNGNGAVRYVECRDLRATVAPKSFFGGDWKILQLRIDQADVHFATADAEIESASRYRGSDGVKAGAVGFGLSADPGAWLVEGMQVRSLNLFWNEPDGMDSWVRQCRLTATDFSGDGKVRLSGGAAAAWGYPPLQVDFAELQFGQDEAQIVRARLREEAAAPGGAGVVEVSGSVDWANEEGVAMEIGIRQFGLERIISEPWRGRLGGRISADLSFDGRLRSGGGGIARGAFTIADGWINGLPVLDAFAEASGDSRFRHLQLEDGFGGSVTLSRGGVAIEDLVIESGALIKVSGSIGWRASGALSGELEVGVPAATLDQFHGGKPSFFGNAEDGFCRARLVASGQMDAPQESLSEVLLAAADPEEAIAPLSGGVLTADREEKSEVKNNLRPINGDSEKAKLEKLFRAILE